jgi:energy-converting hydrogenase B subunit D
VSLSLMPYVIILFCSLLSTFLAYLVVKERDLVIAALLLLAQGVVYSLLHYLLMAPDLLITYIPVSVGITPLLLFLLLKKTERAEP